MEQQRRTENSDTNWRKNWMKIWNRKDVENAETILR